MIRLCFMTLILFLVQACSDKSSGPVEQKSNASSAQFQLRGTFSQSYSFGGKDKQKSGAADGTFCQVRKEWLQVISTDYESSSDNGLQGVSQSFVMLDPTNAFEELGAVDLTNGMLPVGSDQDSIFQVVLTDENKQTWTFKSESCSVEYEKSKEGHLVGTVYCPKMIDIDLHGEISLQGRFTCDADDISRSE